MVILFLIPYGKAVYPASQNSSDSADNTYKVRVSIDDLNVRTGLVLSILLQASILVKVYLLLWKQETVGGRLKSSGWICLDYAVRI